MSEKRRYALRNDGGIPCGMCGAVLPYWTRTEGAHSSLDEHPIVVIDHLADAPTGTTPVPLDDVPPEYRRALWDLSAQYREFAARQVEDGA